VRALRYKLEEGKAVYTLILGMIGVFTGIRILLQKSSKIPISPTWNFKQGEKMKSLNMNWIYGSALFLPSLALAEEVVAATLPAKLDSGDVAWVLASTALVLVMTPGLAFFYGGMVRTKNVVSTLFQNFAAIGLIGIIWAVCGYSLSFGTSQGGFIGGLNFAMLNGVGQTPNADYAATIPHSLFMLFQAMFAVITPILITGAIAERVKFKSFLTFMALWSVAIYAPVAHWVWGNGGWIRNLGGLDFAGGLVVHVTAGFSALAFAMLLGKRRDFNKVEAKPYDTGMILLGTTLLWFGWFGFNAGSALSANGIAVQAFGTTFFASAAAFLSWAMVDTFKRGKPSLIGAGIGAVAGLVAVTPAAGFITFGSSILIGLVAGSVCNLAVGFMKETLKFDDTLDVFGCHGVGGIIGVLATGILASKSVNSAGADGLLAGSADVLKANVSGALAVAAISFVGTIIIYKVVDAFMGIRVSDKDEEIGLDESQHGEAVNSHVSDSSHAAHSHESNKKAA
jgi:Amt family ammonium transporter